MVWIECLTKLLMTCSNKTFEMDQRDSALFVPVASRRFWHKKVLRLLATQHNVRQSDTRHNRKE